LIQSISNVFQFFSGVVFEEGASGVDEIGKGRHEISTIVGSKIAELKPIS